jgi:hypothetical protein
MKTKTIYAYMHLSPEVAAHWIKNAGNISLLPHLSADASDGSPQIPWAPEDTAITFPEGLDAWVETAEHWAGDTFQISWEVTQ